MLLPGEISIDNYSYLIGESSQIREEHTMSRLYPMLSLTLLVMANPIEEASAPGDMAKLLAVRVEVEELGQYEKYLGLNKKEIETHAIVSLLRRLPRLVVSESAKSVVQIRTLIGIGKMVRGREKWYFGAILITVSRPVTILKTGRSTKAIVWNRLYSLTGPPGTAAADVRENLERLLTDFSADWHRDNP
jgi:hypothetical protein